MALYGAFSSSMLGMMSQSYAMETVSVNIANVSTGGYKRTDTSFSTVLSKTIDQVSDIGGVKPMGRAQISQQGAVVSSPRELDVAILGAGFFTLNSARDGSGETAYTRDGSFFTTAGDDITVTADDGVSTITTQESYLVDKNGYYLMGWQPQNDGSFNTAGTMSAMRVDSYAFESVGVATTNAILNANLPANEETDATHLYNIRAYDSEGADRNVTLEFTKQAAQNAWGLVHLWQDTPTAQVDTVTLGGTMEVGDQYSVTVNGATFTTLGTETTLDEARDELLNQVNAHPSIGSTVTASAGGAGELLLTADAAGSAFTSSATATDGGVNPDNAAASVITTANDDGKRSSASTTITFSETGKLATPETVAITPTYASGGTVSLSLNIADMTQYAGDFVPQTYWQDGYGAGQLQSTHFDSDGHVVGNFSNTQVRKIYRLGLAQFSNADGLEMVNGNLFKETELSGAATSYAPGQDSFAILSPNSLELSNVDIADEFSTMIVTQNAYNSAATVFRTVDEMTTVARDLKR